MNKNNFLIFVFFTVIFGSCTLHPIAEETKHPTLFLTAKTKIVGRKNDTTATVKLIIKNHARKTSYNNMAVFMQVLNAQGDSICFIGCDFKSPALKPHRKQTLTKEISCYTLLQTDRKPAQVLVNYLYGKPVETKTK